MFYQGDNCYHDSTWDCDNGIGKNFKMSSCSDLCDGKLPCCSVAYNIHWSERKHWGSLKYYFHFSHHGENLSKSFVWQRFNVGSRKPLNTRIVLGRQRTHFLGKQLSVTASFSISLSNIMV